VAGLIEIEIAGVTVRIGRGADATMIAAVLHVLKVGR
jgi:transposase